MAPERFGKYELIRRLAFGGMAEIFLASLTGEQGFAKKVVVKRILPQFSSDPDFVQMFIDEAVIAARLTHANIVQVYDFGEVEGTYFIAMEWVDGVDLSSLLKRNREAGRSMSAPEVAAIGEAVARGLSYAHNFVDDSGRALDLVHRDISPHNIMLSRSGEPKVMDFGIAKASERATRTKTGMIKGKIAYMAPEQAQGLPIDKRADQFAVGLVLWECITGQRLFSGDSDMEMLRKVMHCETRPPRELRGDAPEELERIVMRALSPDREQRYADLADLERELSGFRFSLGTAGAVQLGSLVDAVAPRKPTGEVGKSVRKTIPLEDHVGGDLGGTAGGEGPSAAGDGTVATAAAASGAPGATTATPAPGGWAAAPDPAVAAWATSREDEGTGGWGDGTAMPTALTVSQVTPSGSAIDAGAAVEAAAAGAPAIRVPRPQRRGVSPWALGGGAAALALLGAAVALVVAGSGGDDAAVVGPVGTATHGTLTIRSEPPGAAITIGGADVGLRTPAPIPGQPLGQPVQIELRLDGYEPGREVVTLTAPTQEITLPLRPRQVAVVGAGATGAGAPIAAGAPANGASANADGGASAGSSANEGPNGKGASADGGARPASGASAEAGAGGSVPGAEGGARADAEGGADPGGPRGKKAKGRAKGRRAEAAAKAAPQESGTLSLRTRTSWAEVFLGSRSLGTTPLRQVEIPAGTHILRLVNRDLGLKKSLRIRVGAGEHVKETVALE